MKKKYVLPSMEHKFKIQVTGEESGMTFTGDFLYRRPTLRERAQIDALRARLSGDYLTLSPDVGALNEALAYLRFTLREWPDWWKESDFGGDLYDPNVIIEIFNKTSEFEAKWKEKVLGGDPEKVEDGADQESKLAAQES